MEVYAAPPPLCLSIMSLEMVDMMVNTLLSNGLVPLSGRQLAPRQLAPPTLLLGRQLAPPTLAHTVTLILLSPPSPPHTDSNTNGSDTPPSTESECETWLWWS